MTRYQLSCLLAAASVIALSGEACASQEAAAPADAAADRFQVVVRADKHATDRVLAVRQAASALPGEAVFAAYSNYRAFIQRLEVRIVRPGFPAGSDEPLAVLPVDASGKAHWLVPADIPEGAGFVLRAYGAEGKWDETRVHPLVRSAQTPDADAAFGVADETAHAAIAAQGVTLTVRGRADPLRQKVTVEGLSVPVDRDGLFAYEQIVPQADGKVHVAITEGDKPVFAADRHYNAADNRWFVVGQGDLTFSHSVANGPAVAVSGDPLARGDHLSSRGAIFAKGVVGNDYRVTASIDTGEVLLKDLFSNLDRKDPSQLLRRLDERYQYPTFGDGSTITEDAPTQGRFYARVQKDDSNLVIGNFITAAQGTELVQLDRGLFGAMLDYKSKGRTTYGDRKRQLLAFASDPGTITASDELRGTGGSLYYLRHQDLSVGSERLRLEVRSAQTGAILSSTHLRLDEDYEIDYFQGRVTLLRPLASYLSGDELVRAFAGTGANVPVLVARYEYTPPEGSIGGHSVGGRATQWIGDWLRLGVTGQSETSAPANQLALGGDIMLKAGADTWLKGELGRTDGPGFAQATSLDGGLNYAEQASSAQAGRVARAFRIEGALDERDLSSSLRGKASGFYEDYEAGFAAMGRISAVPMRRWGGKLDQPIGQSSSLSLALEGRRDQGSGGADLLRVDWKQALSPAWSVRTGLRYENTLLPAGTSAPQGRRLDGGIQLGYEKIGATWSAYVFGQGTLDHDASRRANDRLGLGLKWQLSDSLSLKGEASDGTGGWTVDASAVRRGRRGSESHIGYRLYSDVVDRGYDPQELMTQASRGMLVLGSRQAITDTLTLTGEEKYGHGGISPSLSHSYGLRFSPDKTWSFDASAEKSIIFDRPQNQQGGIDRTALTFAVGYVTDPLIATSAVEYRRDKQGGSGQKSWLFKDKIEVRPDAAWRLLGHFEYAFTDVSGASLKAADYTRAVVGAAYRPVANDRLNVLARYTYFRDLGPAGQIMSGGGIEQPKQVSQVISIDASYDLTGWLTLGGKYAWRQGRVSITRASDTFVDSAASLYAARADIRFARSWEALVEGRDLTASLTHDNRLGILVAIYRQIGHKMKLGAGYNFADYSSDLTDQSYSAKGFFVNLLAAF